MAVGDTTSGLCPGGVAPFGGTNCYFFGGYPANPFSSFWLRLEGEPFSGCPPPSVYCTPKTSSSGCTPSVGWSGTPTPSGGFTLLGTDIEGGQVGVGIYSLAGPNAIVFQGGFLCILPPVVRLPVQGSGGSLGTCTGSFATSLQPLVNMLLPGTQVWIQYWFRDSGAASGTGLSDALTIIRC